MNNTVPYTDMKDSGIKWIGSVPASWNVRTLYQLATRVNNKNSDLFEQNLLSLSYGKIKRKDINTNDGLLPASFDGYNIIEAGDIVLRLTDLQNDHTSLRVGHATERGIITSAYTTLRPINPAHSRYLYYLIHAFDLKKGFYGMGSGVRQGLNYDEVKELRVVLPSQREQEAITRCLDAQCSQIDDMIQEAKDSIEEYKKWRCSIIFETVIKGMVPNVQMRRVSNSWIYHLPVGVELSRVGLHFDIVLGKMLCSQAPNDSYTLEPYYCAANVHFDGVDSSNLKEMWFNKDEKERYLVKQGDLLVVEGGAGAGGCAIAPDAEERYVQNSIMIVRPRHDGDARYLKYLLEMFVSRGYVDFVCNKATIPHFTKEKLSSVPFPVFKPEDIGVMCDYLDRKYQNISELICEKQQLIAELDSYKRSLIYETVTGKRKVV